MLVVYADGPNAGRTVTTDARLVQSDRVIFTRSCRHFEYRIARRYAKVVVVEFVRRLSQKEMALLNELPVADARPL